MAIERASVQVVRKPWGRTDLRPWSGIEAFHDAVGELWFQRVDKNAPDPALLLKLLFTNEPLSIQVHPDDAFARSMGLPNGKTEAWYILSAAPDAQAAVGLKRRVTPQELHASIRDGSIADLVQWRPGLKGDTIFVPAGTIHAIGAGIVLAEIQQHSDATFPYVRLRAAARAERRQRRRRFRRRPGSNAIQSTMSYRCPNASHREPAFCSGADQSPRGFKLGAACRAGNLDSGARWARGDRIGRRVYR